MQIENLQHRNSTYKYVKIRKELPLSPAVDSFVYVGNDEEVFNELSANFKTAHSCVSLENVSSLLNELNHSATIPQFLFIDIPFSAPALNSLKKFLSTDTAFTQS